MTHTDYIPLDVAPVFTRVPVNERGKALAKVIENTTWYNFEETRINPPVVKSLVGKLKRANRRTFPDVWDEFREYADSHGIWLNENY